MRGSSGSWMTLASVLAFVLVLAGCQPVRHGTVENPESGAAVLPVTSLDEARSWIAVAQRSEGHERAARAWLRCASSAWRVAEAGGDVAAAALGLDTQCTARLIDQLNAIEGAHWPDATDLAGERLAIHLRPLSSNLVGRPSFTRADAVVVPEALFGSRGATHAFGVALVASTVRCTGQPRCKLFPPEAVTRPAVAWVQVDASGQSQLVVDDPLRHSSVQVGAQDVPLSIDTTAPYAALASMSQLKQQAITALLGSRTIAMRQGLYLLDDYDPNKIPIVMLHGLGASPLIWARLTARIQASPALRERYQVWHVLYPTDAPVLLSRYHVKQFLDEAWRLLDPDDHDAARQHIVLVGHSMGGMIARLLTAQSGDTLWNAAFTVPITQLAGSDEDIDLADRIFHFNPYPGVDTAFFLAAPHHGSPVSDALVGRFALHVVKPRTPEIDALFRLTEENPNGVRPELVANIKMYGLSSITTLRMDQPVSRAASNLLPVEGVRYFTIAGNLAGAELPGDGIVPIASSYLPGAVSTQTVNSGHELYRSDEAIKLIVDELQKSSEQQAIAGRHP